MQDHLKENGLKLSETDYIVGRTLNFDSETETVIGDSEANQLLNGSYRALTQFLKRSKLCFSILMHLFLSGNLHYLVYLIKLD